MHPALVAALVLDPVPGPDAQHAAREELRKAQYHRDDPSLIDRALAWLARKIAWLFSGGTGGNALLVALIIIAAIVIFAIVRAGPPRATARLSEAELADPLRPLAAADHRRAAEELTAAGRLNEALREWLRAAVQTIEDRGVLPPRPGRTGAAVAREAGALLPSAAANLDAATIAFDEVWFGGRTASVADVAAARAAATQVADARVVESAGSLPPGYAIPW